MPLTLGDVELCVRDDGVTVGIGDRRYEGAPLDTDTLADLVSLRRHAGPRDYGARLFDGLFGGEARAAYLEALTDRDRQWRIHLDLRSSDEALAHVWWESLTAKGPPPTYLGHSYRTPFSRRPPPSIPPASYDAVNEDRLKVLVVVSTPTDLGRGDWQLPALDEQILTRTIETAMRPLADRVEFDIQTTPASVRCIRERLEDERFHVLHLLGHVAVHPGDSGACFVLENDDETAAAVGHEQLAELVMDLPDLGLVVLASCDTGSGPNGGSLPEPEIGLSLAPTMIEYGVPAVIAMHEVVDSEVARLFTEKFYSSLGRSKTGLVDEAVNRARGNIFWTRRDTWDWTAPVLFMSGSGRLVVPYAGAVEEPNDSQPVRTAPRVLKPPTPPALRGPTVWRGKSAEPIEPPKMRAALTEWLIKLKVTESEITIICGALPIELSEITADTSEVTVVRLVDIAVEREVGHVLEGRIRALAKTRAKPSRPPTRSVESEPRAFRGSI